MRIANLRTSVSLSVCAMLLSFLPSCARGKTNIVRGAFVPAAYYLPFIIMESDGLLEKRGFSMELKKYQDNAEMISLFLNGELDVTAQSALTMFPVEAKHPGLLKFVYGQYNRSYFFIAPQSNPAKTVNDLKGLEIGTWRSPTAAAFIKLLMLDSGVDYNETKQLKQYAATEWPTMIQNGTVPIVFGFDIPAQHLVATGKFKYVDKGAISRLLPEPGVFNGGAFIRTQLIVEEPKKAAAIRDALFEALEIIRRDPDHVFQIVAKRLNFPIEIVKESPFDEFVWPNDTLLNSAERTQTLLLEAGIMKQAVDVKGLFWLTTK